MKILKKSFANNNHETHGGVSGEISSLDDEANFCLGAVYRFERTIPFNDRNLFSQLYEGPEGEYKSHLPVFLYTKSQSQ